MNTDVESVECIHGMCYACRYEDCACLCHIPIADELEDLYDMELEEEFLLNGYY